MNQVTIFEDVLDAAVCESFPCGDVREFLASRYETFPEYGRIFHERVTQDADVTPFDEAGIERLGRLQGNFYVVIYPNLPLWAILLIVSIAVVAVSVVIGILLRPSLSANTKNTQQTSPNNSLSDRQNSQRLLERIPDIIGTVQSIPDLLAVPYKIFRNNQEVELSYMCVGRGEYEVESFDLSIEITLFGISFDPGGSP